MWHKLTVSKILQGWVRDKDICVLKLNFLASTDCLTWGSKLMAPGDIQANVERLLVWETKKILTPVRFLNIGGLGSPTIPASQTTDSNIQSKKAVLSKLRASHLANMGMF